MKIRILFLGMLLMLTGLIYTPHIFAQQIISAATLSGVIRDSNGASLSGTNITATNLETNQMLTATSDAEGRFRFNYLPVGSYQLNTQSSGFAPVSQKITLSVGQALDLTLQLKPANVSAKVDVMADSLTIETSRTQVAETILPKDVDKSAAQRAKFS